jgi:RecA/RadA recombinase
VTFTRRSHPAGSGQKISDQVDESLARRKAAKARTAEPPRGGLISTGSTLLDLAISGGIYERGGLPGGILVEIFGPSGAGKTVLLCEIAGGVQRAGGEVKFNDPEARLNRQFASLFGFDASKAGISMPDTVTEVFGEIREWKPKDPDRINGVMADSLAALSTDMEMDGGDKMGQRRAKEFSEQLRVTCRTITKQGFLVVCSNQVRHNMERSTNPYAEKYKTPGGEATGFYASLRLQCRNPEKIKRKLKIGGKEEFRVVGVETDIYVYKSSIWEPYHTAPVKIMFDYGIDDVSANLEYLKQRIGATTYNIGNDKYGSSLESAAHRVEAADAEHLLRDEVIRVWREVEERFKVERQPKRRD